MIGHRTTIVFLSLGLAALCSACSAGQDGDDAVQNGVQISAARDIVVLLDDAPVDLLAGADVMAGSQLTLRVYPAPLAEVVDPDDALEVVSLKLSDDVIMTALSGEEEANVVHRRRLRAWQKGSVELEVVVRFADGQRRLATTTLRVGVPQRVDLAHRCAPRDAMRAPYLALSPQASVSMEFLDTDGRSLRGQGQEPVELDDLAMVSRLDVLDNRLRLFNLPEAGVEFTLRSEYDDESLVVTTVGPEAIDTVMVAYDERDRAVVSGQTAFLHVEVARGSERVCEVPLTAKPQVRSRTPEVCKAEGVQLTSFSDWGLSRTRGRVGAWVDVEGVRAGSCEIDVRIVDVALDIDAAGRLELAVVDPS